MKIIKTDNFDRENRPDVLIAESVHPYYAASIAELLNKRYSGSVPDDYFMSVADDYKLFVPDF